MRAAARSSSRNRISPAIEPPPKDAAVIGSELAPCWSTRRCFEASAGSVPTTSFAARVPTSSPSPPEANRFIVPSSCSIAVTFR